MFIIWFETKIWYLIFIIFIWPRVMYLVFKLRFFGFGYYPHYQSLQANGHSSSLHSSIFIFFIDARSTHVLLSVFHLVFWIINAMFFIFPFFVLVPGSKLTQVDSFGCISARFHRTFSRFSVCINWWRFLMSRNSLIYFFSMTSKMAIISIAAGFYFQGLSILHSLLELLVG